MRVTFIPGGRILTTASLATGAGIRIPHGVVPTAPLNGDFWTTTAGVFARVNGVTVGPFGAATGSRNINGGNAFNSGGA